MSPVRRTVRLVGFILLQVVVVVALLEIVARIFDPLGISYFPENARYIDTLIREEPIGYRNQPGLHDQFHGAPVRINHLGLRDREVGDKVSGEYRILVMGDSVPFGIGVRYEDSYPHQLELLLNERHAGRRFRTLNMGVPSYNTEQELTQLKTLGLQLQPDAATLFFSSNDIEPKLWSLNKQKGWYTFFVRRSYAGSLLTLAFQKSHAWITGKSSGKRDPNARSTLQVSLDQYRLDSPRWQAIDRSLTEMHAILKARRIPFILFASLKQPYITELLEGVARREGFAFVNILPSGDPRWAGQDERRFHNSVVDGHPSPHGNLALATLAAESLERYRVLGQR